MAAPAIKAENLSKKFTLHPQKRLSIKERIVRGKPPPARELWALRDASFEVERGEAMGIIGHNGAGKSTALKVLTGVYRPTSGNVSVNGRVSALLELGAGFHPELNGRENIRLNGSILGLGRKQIDALMDEIIDFSGIEEFIDEPVKIYSSGMFVRLGFSIAVNLDPEILIMDEVIAVGDEAFQRKCMDHLYQLRRDGCSIILVSHSMGSIQEICDRAVWLDHGAVQSIGSAADVCREYMDAVNETEIAGSASGSSSESSEVFRGSGEIRIRHVEFLDEQGNPADRLQSRQSHTFRFHYRCEERAPEAVLSFEILNERGDVVSKVTSEKDFGFGAEPGDSSVDFSIPDLLLNTGHYVISTAVTDHGKTLDARDRDFAFRVQSTDPLTGGAVTLPGEWSRQI